MARSSENQAVRFVAVETRRAWDAVAPGLRRRGLLDDRRALGLVLCCQQFSQYRLLLAARRRWPADREIPPAVERARRLVREGAAALGLLPMNRIHVGALTSSGADVALSRLFGIVPRPEPRAQHRPRRST